jgi:16S rRNA (guanine(966)-N(2))-methyltransferase RsmD
LNDRLTNNEPALMGQVRIIGGLWKRTLIPVGATEGLRPTPDRVRETLFNWLGQNLSGWHCLDMFAGSGSLGFEAGSRGALQVVFLERTPECVKSIQVLIDKLKANDRLRVIRADVFSPAFRLPVSPSQGIPEHFDLILCDPPFGQGLLDRAVPIALKRLADDGLLYLEAESALTAQWAAAHGLELLRADKAGMVHYHLLRRHERQGVEDADSDLPGNL